ncbi:hypothetical protein CUB90_20050 [Clostridium sp. CT7]|nr:hypothetical protein CUB90_20050 [Clostridium sp. CT7]
MIDEKQLCTLKYFFECYFNVSTNYSELDKLIKEYKKIESEKYVKDLKEEIRLVLSINNIEFIRDFIKKYGMRNIKDDSKIKLILNRIMNNI